MHKKMRSTRPAMAMFFSFLLTISFFGLAQSAPPILEKTAPSDIVTIDSGDLLYVIIPKEVTGEFSPTERSYFKEKVEVDRHGFIFLPTQGNIKVSGHSTAKISEILTNNLPKYLSKSDNASVNLIEKRHYIQILGHVAMPGWYSIPESANIQAILGQAGGALEGANLAKVRISRKVAEKTKHISADVQAYLTKGNDRMLPGLHENDTVFVPLTPARKEASGSKSALDTPKIRIFGAVRNPGIYPAPNGMNLLDLLISAHGETADADLTKITILRANGEKEQFNMQASLDTNTPRKKVTFPQINDGDIVHIIRKEPGATPAAPLNITLTGPGSNSQGLQPFSAPTTPFQAIAQAGGLSDFADRNDIIILRRVNGKQQRLPFNYDKALKGEEPDVNFQLKAGDVIYIP